MPRRRKTPKDDPSFASTSAPAQEQPPPSPPVDSPPAAAPSGFQRPRFQEPPPIEQQLAAVRLDRQSPVQPLQVRPPAPALGFHPQERPVSISGPPRPDHGPRLAPPRPQVPVIHPQGQHPRPGPASPRPAHGPVTPRTAPPQVQAPVFRPPVAPVAPPAAVIQRGSAPPIQALAPETAPASSLALRFPRRPGFGSLGTKCPVKANHFAVKFSIENIFHYDVSINPEVKSRGVNRAVIDKLKECYSKSHLRGRLPAYDGRKSLYTSKELPFESQDFEVKLEDEDNKDRTRSFRVKLKLANTISLNHLHMFLAGRQSDIPQEALQAFDVVLREMATRRYTPSARSFFSATLGCQTIGSGLEGWRGFYQSVRPNQTGLCLNLDLAVTAFIQPLPVVEYLEQKPGRKLERAPTDADRSKIKRALRGLKVEVTHRGNVRRKYRVSDITAEATRDLKFPVDESGTLKSVVEYFKEAYNLTLKYPYLPALRVGNPQRINYLPMEVCQIVKGQRYPKRLDENQVSRLRGLACPKPHEREADIRKSVVGNRYDQDEYAREFGVVVNTNLTVVEGRVLPPPTLKYHDNGAERECRPWMGQWNMQNKKVVDGAQIKSWGCLDFCRLNPKVVSDFCAQLIDSCNSAGMVVNPQPLWMNQGRTDQVESILRRLDEQTKSQTGGAPLGLLIVLLPDVNGYLYGEVKRVCETCIGLISQCCLQKHVVKIKPQYLTNVALKINVKVGGRNMFLMDAVKRQIPLVTDVATIVFGADVTHPQPGEDASPSIAAVVASMDWPEISKYAGVVRAQTHRQEMIEHHGGMIRELLLQFYRSTKRKPERIIFYRDGVSEGQFLQVLRYELDAIRKACASLENNYKPPITFVVVQKRHHTRLFPKDYPSDPKKNANVPPGTVVDRQICHPNEFDFYLCSHVGIQGTSRPAHYHVLWDENRFTADRLQKLTNDLCYTYARSTTAVSYVPPAYYAHLAAFRARFYLPRGNLADPVPQLPPLHENIKSRMFYC